MERVIIFIDGSNFYFGCKNFGFRPPWDVVALARELVGEDRKLVRVYYYNARVRPDDTTKEKLAAEDKYYEFLRNIDYCTVRLGRIEGKPGATYQKGVDTMIVQDMLTLTFYNAMDCAIIITNDSDFAQVIGEIKSRGKQVEVAFFGRPAYHIREVCDKYIDLATFSHHLERAI